MLEQAKDWQDRQSGINEGVYLFIVRFLMQMYIINSEMSNR
jgi:hypothetical protein